MCNIWAHAAAGLFNDGSKGRTCSLYQMHDLCLTSARQTCTGTSVRQGGADAAGYSRKPKATPLMRARPTMCNAATAAAVYVEVGVKTASSTEAGADLLNVARGADTSVIAPHCPQCNELMTSWRPRCEGTALLPTTLHVHIHGLKLAFNCVCRRRQASPGKSGDAVYKNAHQQRPSSSVSRSYLQVTLLAY